MKISELIKKLEEIKKEYGDVKVLRDDDEYIPTCVKKCDYVKGEGRPFTWHYKKNFCKIS